MDVFVVDNLKNIKEELKIEKPRNYKHLLELLLSKIKNIPQSYEIFILDKDNKEIIINNDDQFQNIKDILFIREIEKNNLKLSLFSKNLNELSESKKEILSEKYSCLFCSKIIKNEDPIFCYKCQKVFHKKCLEDWDKKCKEQNKNLTCPNCRNELSLEQWNKKLEYEENRQNDAYLINKINEFKINNNMNNNINIIKERKLNELKDENNKQTELIIKYENYIRKTFEIFKYILNKLNSFHISLKLEKNNKLNDLIANYPLNSENLYLDEITNIINEEFEIIKKNLINKNIPPNPINMEENNLSIIFQRKDNNENINISIPENKTLLDACNLYQNKTGDIGPFKLTFNDKPLDLNLKLSQSGLKNNSIIQIESINKNNDDKISLLFERSDGKQNIINIFMDQPLKANFIKDKNENINQIKDLKIELDKRNNEEFNEKDNNEDSVKNLEKENIKGENDNKLIKLYAKAYDPKIDQGWNLISQKQKVVQSQKDKMFDDRYKTIQKMNRLSKILLPKNENISNQFNKQILTKTVIGGKKPILKRKPKFLYVVLAMMSSKGLNAKDRLIFRSNKCGREGGVVDLAQEKRAKRYEFKIKKARAFGRGHNLINPKYREKAAKIVQGWWRERKENFEKILKRIIKIQSAYRGRFTRKYVFDIVYISYLYQKFYDIIKRALVNHVRQKVWNEFFSRKKISKEEMEKLLEKNDNQ